MDVPDAKRLRALEAENAKLKKLLAEAMLDNEALTGAAYRWLTFLVCRSLQWLRCRRPAATTHTVGIVAMQDVREPVWRRRYGQTAGVSIKSSLDTSIVRGHVTATGVISTTHGAPFSLGNAGCRVMRYRPDGSSHTSILARSVFWA